MRVVITEAAWEDMLRIGRGIQQESPKRADAFVNELYDRCESLAGLPEAFPLVPGHEGSGIRRRPYGNYLIFYRVADDLIEVLRIIHGARDYQRVLFPDD